MAVRMDCGIGEVIGGSTPPDTGDDEGTGVGTRKEEGTKVGTVLVGAGGREGGEREMRIVKSSKQHISFPIHHVTSDCGQNKYLLPTYILYSEVVTCTRITWWFSRPKRDRERDYTSLLSYSYAQSMLDEIEIQLKTS